MLAGLWQGQLACMMLAPGLSLIPVYLHLNFIDTSEKAVGLVIVLNTGRLISNTEDLKL